MCAAAASERDIFIVYIYTFLSGYQQAVTLITIINTIHVEDNRCKSREVLNKYVVFILNILKLI